MKKIALIGGSGFVGQALMNALVDTGYQVRIIGRKQVHYKRAESSVYDPAQPDSLTAALKGSDIVFNLVGILNSRLGRDNDFYQAHVVLTKHILLACKSNRIQRYLHVSALNANKQAPSLYLRTKGEAEDLAHHTEGIVTTSFQASVMFGRGDGLLNRFAKILKFAPPVFPLACADTIFAPVYVGDVVHAMVESIEQRKGQRVPLCGPEHYSLAEIVQFVCTLIKRRIYIVPLSDGMSKLQAYICNWVPGKPFSLDNYYSLQLDSVCTDAVPCPTQLSVIGKDCLGD